MEPTTSSAIPKKYAPKEHGISKMVHMRGASLIGFSREELIAKLTECSIVKFDNVLKKPRNQAYCLVTFKSNAEAANFFYNYCGRRARYLCHQLPGLEIRPGFDRKQNVVAIFDKSDYDDKLPDIETWCKCRRGDGMDVEVSRPEAPNAEGKRVKEELAATLRRRIGQMQKDLELTKENLKIVKKHLSQLQ
ncbi:unnamed protein product [Umbelopsis ramanniana]